MNSLTVGVVAAIVAFIIGLCSGMVGCVCFCFMRHPPEKDAQGEPVPKPKRPDSPSRSRLAVRSASPKAIQRPSGSNLQGMERFDDDGASLLRDRASRVKPDSVRSSFGDYSPGDETFVRPVTSFVTAPPARSQSAARVDMDRVKLDDPFFPRSQSAKTSTA